MPTIVVLHAEHGRLAFEARGVSVSEANALRVALLNDVPVAGVESVRVEAASTFMPDDTLVDRLRQLPIGLSGEAWDSVPPREALSTRFPCRSTLPRGARGRLEVCERGCERCVVRFRGCAKHQPAFESRDLEFAPCSGGGGGGALRFEVKAAASDAEAAALGECGFLIARMEPGQVIKVSGTLRIGTGREHIGFRAVCGPLHMDRAHRVRVDADAAAGLSDASAAALLRACPVGLLTFDPASRSLEVANPARATNEAERVNAAGRAAARECGLARSPVEVEVATDVFAFSLDLRGQVGPRVLLREAARAWAAGLGRAVSIDWV